MRKFPTKEYQGAKNMGKVNKDFMDEWQNRTLEVLLESW